MAHQRVFWQVPLARRLRRNHHRRYIRQRKSPPEGSLPHLFAKYFPGRHPNRRHNASIRHENPLHLRSMVVGQFGVRCRNAQSGTGGAKEKTKGMMAEYREWYSASRKK